MLQGPGFNSEFRFWGLAADNCEMDIIPAQGRPGLWVPGLGGRDIIPVRVGRPVLRRLVAAALLVAVVFGGAGYYERSWVGDALALDDPEASASPSAQGPPDSAQGPPDPSASASPSPSPSPEPSPSPSPSPSVEPPVAVPNSSPSEPSSSASAETSPPPVPPPPPAPVYPGLPAGSGAGRRIVYSNSQQRIWLVEGNESIAASWLVSGRRGVPRPGAYGVFSKSRYSSAHGGRVRMEFMVRFARGRRLAIGFHSIPVGRRGPLQTEAQLGTFRSAGCVRQLRANAETLWNWAPIGTRVVVTT